MDTFTPGGRSHVWVPLAAVTIGGLFFVFGSAAHGDTKAEYTLRSGDTAAQITVTGEGKVTVSPDLAELSFGVTTGRVATAKQALAKLSTSMNAVVDAVKKLGIDEKDIVTAQLSMNPVYDYTQNGQIPRGFEASQTLSVKVRDLDKIGDVLGAATQAGANNAGGVNFTIDNPDDLKTQARSIAIKKAQAHAKLLADQLGVKLGKVHSFMENGGGYSPPIMMREGYAAGVASDAKALPVPSGQQDILSNVTLTYDIE